MNQESVIYGCLRCHRDYCILCNPPIEIKFDVKDGVYYRRDYQSIDEFKRLKNTKSIMLVGQLTNYKGYRVCPFCYNQLLEIKKEGKRY